MSTTNTRRALLELAEQRLKLRFPPRFSAQWESGVDVPGRSTPARWLPVLSMAKSCSFVASLPDGVGFPNDDDPDFFCLFERSEGDLSEVVYYFDHVSRDFEAVEPYLGAKDAAEGWDTSELISSGPLACILTEPKKRVRPRRPDSDDSDAPEEAADLVSPYARQLAGRLEAFLLGSEDNPEDLFSQVRRVIPTIGDMIAFQLACQDSPAELVRRVIQSGPPDPSTIRRDELVTLVTAAHRSGTDADLAGRALAHHSGLPFDIAHQLGSGSGYFRGGRLLVEELVTFATSYAPPRNEDEVWKLARAWAEDTAEEKSSVLASFGEELLRSALQRIEVPQLKHMLSARTEAEQWNRRRVLGLATPKQDDGDARIPNAEPSLPPKIEKVRHPKFGIGQVESKEGSGPDAKWKVVFEDQTRVLLARFLTPVEEST